MHPVTSVYCRASETLAHLPPSQSSGLFIFYHLLFPMLSSTAFLWLPTSFAHDSNPSYCPPFFFSFHLFSPLFPPQLYILPCVLCASRIFPWFSFSFPSSITLLSPFPHSSLQPLVHFLPSSFHHSIPFYFLRFLHIAFSQRVTLGISRRLKRSWREKASLVVYIMRPLVFA